VDSIHLTRYLGARSIINCCRSFWVLTRSKAFERSRESSAMFFFFSLYSCMLLMRRCNCVAAECPWRYANCSGASLLFSVSQSWKRCLRSFSMILVMVGRSDMGRGSGLVGDLEIGLIIVWLRFGGIVPVSSMLLMSLTMWRLMRSGRRCQNSYGMPSHPGDLLRGSFLRT
jgi:hypothetical protein